MKTMKSALAILLVIAMTFVLLTGCGPKIPTSANPTNNPNSSGSPSNNPQNTPGGGTDPNAETVYDKYAPGTELKMAFGYNSTYAAISFSSNIISEYGDGSTITLSNGKSYRAGELKPTWEELQNRLNIKFQDVYQGNNPANEWAYWENQLDQLQVIYGNLATLNNAGLAGSLVNIADYLDMMPNLKAYLDANPIVYMSITADPETGAIYFSPYFDGLDDIERMTLMRTDWVEKLLNGEGEFTAAADKPINLFYYQPYMPTSGSVTVDVVKADGSGVEQVTKNYAAYGNIIEVMNMADSIRGADAVNMLREYIDKTYDGYYGTNRADLFIGQNAAWDADELVALLRCVVANPQTLNGTDTVFGIFSREDNNMQRKVDTYRFAGTLFGARGLESRLDFLYIDSDGKVHDARQEVASYEAVERMNAMAREGLISTSYLNDEAEKTQTMLENDLGFMHYDYNQTQTLYNQDGTLDTAAGEKYMAVITPVARWYDGTDPNGVYMRFTESWRSVKDSGLAITKAGCTEDQIYAALAMIDYAYSKEGQILQSYGPNEFIKQDASGNMVMFDFNGEQWPEIADSTRTELWAMPNTPGNYTNYARYYLGSTLNFLKSQAFEYQCTADVGREGAGHISKAIGLGVIKHPELAITSNNYWYTIVPSALPVDEQQTSIINGLTDITGNSGRFGTSKGSTNEFVDIIINGYANQTVTSAAAAAAQVTNDWRGSAYTGVMQEAWDLLLDSFG